MKSQQNSEKVNKQPALTIVFESWSIPIIGLAMFLVGMFAGYNLQQDNNTGNVPLSAVTQAPPQPSERLSGSNQEVMDYVLAQTRHFQGDPDAPVTLIEFGDFQ